MNSLVETMNPIFGLAPLVVVLPLLGLLLNLAFGRRLGERGAGVLASLFAGLAFALALVLTAALSEAHSVQRIFLAEWIGVGGLQLDWTFRVDTLSSTMMLVVSGVGTLIHIYAIAYMHSDVRHNGDTSRYRRFFVYFNLFLVAMLLLVSADNYLVLFVGWEGVGLCSYLLIGFWFEKGEHGTANAKAAKKAFIVNRIGDFGLLVSIFLLYWNFGTLQFDAVFAAAPALVAASPLVVLLVTLLMLLGVTGKSAQLPLFVWLPDAMAGPTPVSALIHAATMVTAGVYLVARSSPLFLLSPVSQSVVTWVGALTALFAATIAVGQWDIKKVLAYSTISQLGFMVAAVGMGAYVAGMFHLVTHAFFKALLFLSAGSVILGLEHGHSHGAGHGHQPDDVESPLDLQDMRNMGGLQGKMRLTFWVYLAGTLALAGIAPLAGFFSKDEILASAFSARPAVFAVLLLSAFLTSFYMGRQVFLVFFGRPRSQAAEHARENPPLITVPLLALAFLSVFGGLLNLPGVYTLEHWLESSLGGNLAVKFSTPVALASLLLALLGLGLAWWVYGQRQTQVQPDPLVAKLGFLFRGMQHKWWVDELYQAVFINPFQKFSSWLARSVDLGGIDRAGNGLASQMQSIAGGLRRWQNGFVRSYILTVVIGMLVILTFLAFRM
jgi:NADH-quinone oxidoreductase subunit L